MKNGVDRNRTVRRRRRRGSGLSDRPKYLTYD